MSDCLLTFNSGSSSIKIGLYEIVENAAKQLGRGAIDQRKNCFSFKIDNGPSIVGEPLLASNTMSGAAANTTDEDKLGQVFKWLSKNITIGKIRAVGHRVVHGADIFGSAVVIDDTTFDHMASLIPLDPLHQPANLNLIQVIKRLMPDMVQTASFDTAFHRGQSDEVRRFAIPRALHDKGIKRYGFHGLSYKYIASHLPEGSENKKTIIAHLGSGASLCAIKDQMSIETTMSFSTLDGVPMATRSGAIDPGVLIHLLRDGKQSVKDVETMLYHSSGLLGMSAISADSRDLLASSRVEARQALDVFTLRIAGEIARLCVALNGVDQLIFTAGIGENQPPIRQAILARLGFLGFEVDAVANAKNAKCITTHKSRVSAFVIATDEEQIIADEALSLMADF